ncbi:hypothetical protein VTJ83DRAFT_2915 [Remersonia thermophila]|uniref:EF-hand domain-containing protein n=1 Tax=Remersonia thermophila TaxID=72144 RepID=A0ABR4DDI2_9PEZI
MGNQAKSTARRRRSSGGGNGGSDKSYGLPPSPPASESARDPRGYGPDVGFAIAVPGCSATSERLQAVHAEARIPKPAIARANVAVSTEVPEGSAESREEGRKDLTVLQQHVLFWDRDRDGHISPWDTYRGFRDLGFSVLFSLLSAIIINVSFSYPTRLVFTVIPDPLFRVFVGGIHKAKHGSDSGTYDLEGRFVPQKFEDMFSKWDKDDTGSLSARELWDMLAGHRLAVDPFGWSAAMFEFGTTWLLVQENGSVSKEDLRRTYDGTIFWKIKEARERGEWHKGYGFRDLVASVKRKIKIW